MKRKYLYNATLLLMAILVIAGCKEEEYALPVPKSGLQNDAIKRSLGPNVAGLTMEFAYAAALPPSEGLISFMRVESTIPGAAGTNLDNNAYFTNGSGVDVPVLLGEPSVTNGNLSEVAFNRDTCAATLRYSYVIPPEAKGQSVKFTFSSTDNQGRTVSYPMGPYKVAKMDIALDRNLNSNTAAFISIEDMAVYTAAEAAAIPDKIDLVYLYRVVTKIIGGPNGTPTNVFTHALVSPAADPQYLPGVTLPAGVTKSTKLSKTFNLRYFHLTRTLATSVYIDDVDLEKLNIANAPNFAVNLKAESGMWVETQDGKYRAFIYINAVNPTTGGAAPGAGATMRISMKRLQMF